MAPLYPSDYKLGFLWDSCSGDLIEKGLLAFKVTGRAPLSFHVTFMEGLFWDQPSWALWGDTAMDGAGLCLLEGHRFLWGWSRSSSFRAFLVVHGMTVSWRSPAGWVWQWLRGCLSHAEETDRNIREIGTKRQKTYLLVLKRCLGSCSCLEFLTLLGEFCPCDPHWERRKTVTSVPL